VYRENVYGLLPKRVIKQLVALEILSSSCCYSLGVRGGCIGAVGSQLSPLSPASSRHPYLVENLRAEGGWPLALRAALVSDWLPPK
jgi:hypothetical protein